MAIPTSTVDGVKDYLVTQITTQVNDNSVQVSYDEPTKYLSDDIILVGDIDQSTLLHAFVGSGGAHWLHENYIVRITVSVFRGGDTASVPWKRAKALCDSIDTAVRNDPTLGARVLSAYPRKHAYRTTLGDKGYLVEVDTEIEVDADL